MKRRRKNDNLRCFCVALVLAYCCGCATTIYHPQKTQILTFNSESYLDALNREMREKHVRRRWNQKRHIGFFGFLKRTEKEVGVKVVFPF